MVNSASGEAASFLSVYKAYEKAKDVTAWRLYMDSVDNLLKRSSKVVIQSGGGDVSSVVPFMPLAEGRDKQGSPK